MSSAKIRKSQNVIERGRVTCVVKDCATNKLDLDDLPNSGISFHVFPSNPTARNKWLAWLDNPAFIPKKGNKICSKHFTANSFERNASLAESMGLAKPLRKRLKIGACPGMDFEQRQSSLSASVPPSASGSISLDSVTLTGNFTSEPFGLKTPTETLVGTHDEPTSTTIRRTCSKRSLETREDDRVTILLQNKLPTTSCQDSQVHPNNIPGLMQTKQSQTNKLLPQFGFKTSTYMTRIGVTTQTSDSESDTDATKTHSMVDNNDKECDSNEQTSQETDKKYLPSQLPSSETLPESNDPVTERKFLIFESAILQLFAFCHICRAECNNSVQTKDTATIITSVCWNNHRNIWYSQPSKKQTPFGNPLLAASILISGLNPSQVLRMLKNFGLQVFDCSTYFRIRKAYLLRAVKTVWESEQLSILNSLKGQELSLGGDGRMDKPGLNAKYGVYTFLETSVKKVVHQTLVKSNKVMHRVGVEIHIEGLTRGVQFLVSRGFKIKNIITDGQIQVRTFLKRTYPAISHYFDVWHLVKSVRRRIRALTKKSTDILRQWSRSIQNHLRWLVSSSNGDINLMKSKWLSVPRHVSNQHREHGQPFDSCEHDDDMKDKLGCVPEFCDYDKFETLVGSVNEDIGQLAPFVQTSLMEAFHAVVIHFTPKNIHYSYYGMTVRLAIAALHFNENSNQIQAITTSKTNGEQRRSWKIIWPKTNGEAVSIRAIMDASTYDYVDRLLKCVMELASHYKKKGSKKTVEKLGSQSLSWSSKSTTSK